MMLICTRVFKTQRQDTYQSIWSLYEYRRAMNINCSKNINKYVVNFFDIHGKLIINFDRLISSYRTSYKILNCIETRNPKIAITLSNIVFQDAIDKANGISLSCDTVLELLDDLLCFPPFLPWS